MNENLPSRPSDRERAVRALGVLDEAEVAAPGPDPEGWASRQEALAELQGFLGELDPDRWAVFVLSEIEGLRGCRPPRRVRNPSRAPRPRTARRDLHQSFTPSRARP